MRRRTLLQAATVSVAMTPALGLMQSTPAVAMSDLITHTVAHALRETAPLLVHSGILTTNVSNQILLEFAGDVPIVEPWVDWNDQDLESVFAAFFVGTPDTPIGSIRIFDTADIAWFVHQPMLEEHAQGYMNVGGMRAARVVTEDVTFASLRLWNVILDAVAPDESTEIAMGMVKYLGMAIGALK